MTKAVTIWNGMSRGGQRPRVSAVIPALNKERNLPHIASRMPSDIDELVFVNGASVDNTAGVARDLWPHAVHITQTRKGKGNALACGFAAASGNIIVMIDADGSNDPAEIPCYLAALISGADFAKGSRFVQSGGSNDITVLRRLGNKGLNCLVNVLFSTQYSGLWYGYNAFWRRCLDVTRLPDGVLHEQWGDGFEVETLINVHVAARGLKIKEVCSFECDRVQGVSNLNPVTDGLRVLRTIRQEFVSARRARKLPRSGVPKRSASAVSTAQIAPCASSVPAHGYPEIIGDTASAAGARAVAGEPEVTI